MGNFLVSKSKKTQNQPKDVFERGKREVQKRREEIKKNADPKHKRTGKLVLSNVILDDTPPGHVIGLFSPTAPLDQTTPIAPPNPGVPDASATHVHSYDDMALDNMRCQLNNDANAFLLNNILLSIQFFENYEREMQQLQTKPISEGESLINDAMIRFNKHVFFADRQLSCVSEHVSYQRNRGELETIAPRRAYVIYDNMEARESGDTSDYSAALDVPFYKLEIEDCKESGYLKLQKLEVLESTLLKGKTIGERKEISNNTIYTDSGNELNGVDDELFTSEYFTHVENSNINNEGLRDTDKSKNINLPYPCNLQSTSEQAITANKLRNRLHSLADNIEEAEEAKAKKTILKNTNKFSGTTRYIKAKDSQLHHQNNLGDDSKYGSSGYGSILSSGSTVTESAILQRIEQHSNNLTSSGVLSTKCWTTVVKKIDDRNDDEEEQVTDTASKYADNSSSDEDDDKIIDSAYKALPITSTSHKIYYYLNSLIFMNNFIRHFKQDLGSGLGFSEDAIRNAMTHGATIYCDSFEDFLKTSYEIIPGLTAKWPNAANQWIIRERKIIQNPRNNYKYQWPIKHIVKNATDLGCLIIPLGYRTKKEPHSEQKEQKIQWRITFPAAENYLESTLAHSHVRCYLFTLVLHKAFMENGMMIGIDASHIKNHLFWQCEHNFAKWPEDRLGESLKLFLGSLHTHFGKSTLPNYFMKRCNEFESIPASVLLSLQRKLKDILETPVMHILYAIDKLKYNSIGFYPTFDCQKLYHILTCRNPLLLSNSNLLATNSGETSGKQRKKIKANIALPSKLEVERQYLVLKFFIPHFIAMARSSEKFDANNQAMVYLEQAQRLCMLLLDIPGGDTIANEYLNITRDKLADCQRKIVTNQGLKLPHRNVNQSVHNSMKQHLTPERFVSQDSVIEKRGIPAITVADIQLEKQQQKENIKADHENLRNTVAYIQNEQKLRNSLSESHGIPAITIADIHKEQQRLKKTTADHGNSKVAVTFIHEEEELVQIKSLNENHKTLTGSCANRNLEEHQHKRTVTEGSRVLTFACANIHLREQQQIQLNDSDIEESYL